MRTRIAAVTLSAALALAAVGAVVLHYYDGGSRDHTYLQVGDCWDYSTRFDEQMHVKPCSGPHYGEVILSGEYADLSPHPSGGLDAWGYCEQRLSEILSKNSHLETYMVPTTSVLCAVTSADHRDTRIAGLTGRVGR
ncbi:hypothetical protein [Nocardia sp. CS682]|uniref:hypothetical protein n=1 Tax=Nocardia sp. CS682 TaxID=1047172 RepID=UPI001074DDF6|nr:hypothetical protein [Nocardia sp. CS682]QBS44576.1 hypothetical protein DMB37_35295 [Nocardia sp. CS682]